MNKKCQIYRNIDEFFREGKDTLDKTIYIILSFVEMNGNVLAICQNTEDNTIKSIQIEVLKIIEDEIPQNRDMVSFKLSPNRNI